MSFTALVWITLYCSAAILSFVNPLYGALGYLLEYYMRPELKWWGHALPSLRYNLIISLVLGISFLVRRSSLREMIRLPNPALRWLLGLTTVMLLVTLTVAVNTPISWSWVVQWVKIALIFPLLVVGVIRTPAAFNAFVAVHMLGAFWWGWDAWRNPHRTQSRLLQVGSGDTFDDNAASAHLLTVVPFILIYLFTEKNTRLRAVALLALPFVINTIILCNSRGSTIGILVAAAASMFLIRSRYRLRLAGVIIGVVAAFVMLADPQFIARQQTTANYEQDSSAQQRLTTWKAGYQLLLDRPLGAGGRGFHLLSPRYIPDIVAAHGGDLRAPHNTWVEVATEWGILGFVCFLGTYGATFLMLRRVKQAARPDENGFYYWRAVAIQLGLIGYLVAGTFTDRVYAEAGYWLVGLTYALYRIQRTEHVAHREAVVPPPEAVRPDILTPWPLADAGVR